MSTIYLSVSYPQNLTTKLKQSNYYKKIFNAHSFYYHYTCLFLHS